MIIIVIIIFPHHWPVEISLSTAPPPLLQDNQLCPPPIPEFIIWIILFHIWSVQHFEGVEYTNEGMLLLTPTGAQKRPCWGLFCCVENVKAPFQGSGLWQAHSRSQIPLGQGTWYRETPFEEFSNKSGSSITEIWIREHLFSQKVQNIQEWVIWTSYIAAKENIHRDNI